MTEGIQQISPVQNQTSGTQSANKAVSKDEFVVKAIEGIEERLSCNRLTSSVDKC